MKFLLVRTEGRRRVRRAVAHYNLDAIISVGYRVNSKRAVRFRQWATRTLRKFLVRGYILNERRLAERGLREARETLDLLARCPHSPDAPHCAERARQKGSRGPARRPPAGEPGGMTSFTESEVEAAALEWLDFGSPQPCLSPPARGWRVDPPLNRRGYRGRCAALRYRPLAPGKTTTGVIEPSAGGRPPRRPRQPSLHFRQP